MNYLKNTIFVFLLIFSSIAQSGDKSWCLDTYKKHYNMAGKALKVTSALGVVSIAALAAGPFGLIPIAVAGGSIATASYYKKQYEKAHGLITESDPKFKDKYDLVLRVAKSAKLSPGQTAQIVWKNEAKFCKGKVPWTYRTIRRAIKKRKLKF